MVKKIYKTMMISFLVLLMGFNNKNEELHVVSFNIRYASPGDGINIWEKRVPVVKRYLNEEMPDIVGMQEVVHSQLIDLQEMMPGYSYVGTGRDDGKQGGEYSPIFFRNDKFDLLEHSQFWLSDTPDVPGSVGWDAAITRVVAWAKLKHKPTGKEFYCFNTHFDHRGVEARQRSADLMSQKITEIAGDAPVIATGDFNIRRNHPSLGNALYYNLIGTFKDNNSLLNTEYISKTPVTTGGITSTGFRPDWKEAEDGYPIDYVFVNQYFEVESYRVDRVMEGEVFISDHWPVVAVISFSYK
jgi:endonuclease/exonuclease/phosphatase family metal-dependent hydrolase